MKALTEPGLGRKQIDGAVTDIRGHPERIAGAYRRSVESIIQVGDFISDAKDDLPHGAFEAMIASALPFGASAARRFMVIAGDPRIRAHVHALPAAWGSLYELTKLDDAQFESKIADGSITPDTERAAILAIRKEARLAPLKAAYAERIAQGCTADDLTALAQGGARFGSISADPNWQYRTWSERGQDRAADQHYATAAVAAIRALPVAQLAADDCAFYLWAMDWLLPGALEVIEAFGFTFIKVAFVWIKQNPSGNGRFMGLGHWTREGAELCLLATKGHPPRLNADVRQVIEAPVREHSHKPDEAYERMRRLTPGPHLELYARQPRRGWTVWGDEIPRRAFLPPKPAEIERPAPADDHLDIPAFLRRGHPECVVQADMAAKIGGVHVKHPVRQRDEARPAYAGSP